MKISKELLEKYHLNACSQEESDAVEAWLFSAESEDTLLLSLNEEKAAHKAQIWKGIESVLPEDELLPAIGKLRSTKGTFWSGAVAASIVFALLGITGYYFSGNQKDTSLLNINNSASMQLRKLEANAYHISVGPRTSARIDNVEGIIDLSGSLLIQPKKDIALKFGGTHEEMLFKAGQTYIILKGTAGNDKVIIVNEKNIIDLPPLLQKQISNEFKI